MTEKQHQRWSRIRKQGMARYVLFQGVIFWGGIMTVVWSLYLIVSNWVFFGIRYAMDPQHLLRIVVPAVILYPLLGLVWGIWTWNASETGWNSYRPDRIADK